jgi:hypothetical protein
VTDNIESCLLIDFVGNEFAVGLEGRNDIDWGVILSNCASCADCPTVDHDGGTIETAHRHETPRLKLEKDEGELNHVLITTWQGYICVIPLPLGHCFNAVGNNFATLKTVAHAAGTH